jgi:hypothetical protein
MSRKYKLNIGDTVTVRMLGSPRVGKVMSIRTEGTYDVRCADGAILPNCDWEDTTLKKPKPWFIVSRDAKGTGKIETENMSDLSDIIEDQKKFLRGEIKK